MQHIDEYMFFITNEGQIVREGSIAGPSTPRTPMAANFFSVTFCDERREIRNVT